jgi:hypothetical protein
VAQRYVVPTGAKGMCTAQLMSVDMGVGRAAKKSKSSPATRHEGKCGERRYSSYSYLTSALDGVSGQRHAPAALYPRGKDPLYPLDRRLGGPQSRSGRRG